MLISNVNSGSTFNAVLEQKVHTVDVNGDSWSRQDGASEREKIKVALGTPLADVIGWGAINKSDRSEWTVSSTARRVTEKHLTTDRT